MTYQAYERNTLIAYVIRYANGSPHEDERFVCRCLLGSTVDFGPSPLAAEEALQPLLTLAARLTTILSR